MVVVKEGWVTLVLGLVIISILAGGCSDVSFGSQKIGDFGDTREEKIAVDHFNATYGNPETTGPARFMEPVVSTGLINNIPVDSVTAFNRNIPRIYVWTYYDNFRKGDQFSLTWTFDGHLAAPVNAAAGDFGRAYGELVPPEGGWPMGSHQITISDITGKANATIRFRIHDGPTEFSTAPFRTVGVPPGVIVPQDQGQPGDEKPGERCSEGGMVCDGICTKVFSDAKNCGTCGRACPPKYFCAQSVCVEGYVSSEGFPATAQWGDLLNLAGEDTTGLGGVCLKLYGPGIGGEGVHLSCVNTTWSNSRYEWRYSWNTLAVPVEGIVREAGIYNVRVYEKDYSRFVTGTIDFTTSSWTVTCPDGQVQCGSSCSSLNTDPANCGACGVGCGSGMGCQDGQCVSGCGAGTTMCNGQCVNLISDTSNCGQCGYGCPSVTNGYPACTQGTCTAACNGGYVNCDGSLSNGCEVYPLSDDSNCGACGVRCGTGQKCADGRCIHQYFCLDGTTNCNGQCVNLEFDTSNCGACGYTCPSVANGNPMCDVGTCKALCYEGYGDCDRNLANGCEKNILTDRANCGGCGVLCMAEFPCCVNGDCVGPSQCPCPSGQTNCGGGCVDLQFDRNNCGACGNVCGQNYNACSFGTCTWIPK